MKGFLEDYGFSILSAVIITIMIVMASPIGDRMIEKTKNIIFGTTFENVEKEKDSNNSNANINMEMNSKGDVTLTVPVRIGGTYVLEYSVKHEGLWSEWIGSDYFKTKKAETKTFQKSYEEIRDLGCGKGDYIKFRVTSNQTETDSNILKCDIDKSGSEEESSKPSTLGLKPNDTITIEGRKYVVLEDKNSNQYLVMDINGVGNKEFNINRNGQDPNQCGYINGIFSNKTCNNQYENSNLDFYLENEYYNSLSFKDAIVEQSIIQNSYEKTYTNPDFIWVGKDNPYYNGCHNTFCIKQSDGTWISWDKYTPVKGKTGAYNFKKRKTVGNTLTRKIFVPSVEEILEIVDVNDQYEINKFLCNSGKCIHMWLRDNVVDNDSRLLDVHLKSSSLSNPTLRETYIAVRPTFVIDLSLVDYVDTGELFVK